MGASFGIAAVGFRGASLSLGGEGFLSQAAYTLTAALAIQTVVMMVAMQLRNPGELKKVARAWKTAVWVGASGAAASVGWFTAMTIQNAALVRALGQIELVFTITASVLIFREKIHRLELIGIFLVVAGILTLLCYRHFVYPQHLGIKLGNLSNDLVFGPKFKISCSLMPRISWRTFLLC
ncbi:MAG: hypothetical protein CM1200mP4_1030 [Rhodospirillaceae bacterium]|nr:MAG: hypothetical protein CM1200mP4_1030 [Rhodospirillaceae bacterium]